MTDNQKRILEMLADKKITVDEAHKLLTLVEPMETTDAGTFSTDESGKRIPRYLRIVVQPNSEGGSGTSDERVNIRVPVALIRAGMKLTSLIPQHAINHANEALHEKGMDLDLSKMKASDLEQLIDALSELEIDVKDGKEKVRVYME